MDNTLLSKVFVFVSCLACASHHQIVASGDAPEPEPEPAPVPASESAPAPASYAPAPQSESAPPTPVSAPAPASVLKENYSAMLLSSSAVVLNGDFPGGGGHFTVVKHGAVEYYYYAHFDMDRAARKNPLIVDTPILAGRSSSRAKSGDPYDAFASANHWAYQTCCAKLNATAPQPRTPDTPSNITPTCQIYRVDIDAPVIDKAKIDYIMSKIGELPTEGLGPISIPPISEQPYGPKTPPHLVNRCIFWVPANASICLGAFFGNHAIRELRLSPPSTNAPATPPFIEEWAFLQCACLQYVEIPDGTPSISRDAFSGCEYLVRVAMPGSVER
ncbi:MAG: leucine-rich repeat domain-containing protein, partial [Holosporales bacterium]|nr:leucine-rich repeat domain-containing protein [Holosporales bacterium]